MMVGDDGDDGDDDDNNYDENNASLLSIKLKTNI